MSHLGNDFRRRAEEHNAQAETLFSAGDFDVNRKTQAAAVIAKTTANMLYLLGELVDYLRESETIDDADARRKQIADRNNAIREAYTAGMTSGDFTNFDQLVETFGSLATGNNAGE